MRSMVIALLTTFLLTSTVANAQESSVYINLSALDALENDIILDADTPLFPIVKAQPKKVVVKKAAKLQKKKNPHKAIKVVEPTKEKLAVSESVEVKVVETKSAETTPSQAPLTEKSEEVIVVDVEPVTAAKVINQPQPNTETKTQEAQASTAQPVVKAEALDEVVSQDTQPQKETGLLVETDTNSSSGTANADTKIVFADEETTLTDAQKAQIDVIINSFTDAVNNKIAIYSYNLDDGTDSFRRKRQSLNRAVEIRSYLLQKGYKNFSIKVLNVDADSGKINSVEIAELK